MSKQQSCVTKLREEKMKKETDFIFFAPDIKTTNQLPEQESRHCIKVLRMIEGDNITITDGKGSIFECIIVNAHHKHTTVSINDEIIINKSWNYFVQIAFAPTKNMDRNEWFIEKATEIGIDRLTPLMCKFSERKEIRTDRIVKTAISAMKQSKQAIAPQIDDITQFDKFVEEPFNGQKYIAHCYNDEKNPLPSVYTKGENALILIGPEGDFSEKEVELAIQNGFKPISLGNNRLRTETACLAACHTIHVLNEIIL